MIKTIIFDLGNVVIFVSNVCAGLKISEYNFLKRHLIRAKIKEYEKGKISTEEFYTWFNKKTRRNIDISRLDNMFEDVFSLNEKMGSLLKKLKNNYRIIALSNTNEANYDFVLKKYDILTIFDDYVLSYKVGYLKPEKKIYELALEKALCKPEECVFIDDRKKFVNAAKKLGINSIQYDYKNHSYLEKTLEELGVLWKPKD